MMYRDGLFCFCEMVLGEGGKDMHLQMTEVEEEQLNENGAGCSCCGETLVHSETRRMERSGKDLTDQGGG